MKHILSSKNIEILAQFSWSRLLVALDFDGTLAPIVADREQARMRPRTHTLLEKVSQLYPCAVISGRSMEDVRARLEGIPAKYLIGNHGLEPGENIELFEPQIHQIRPELEQELKGIPGIDIEDKRYSLAVHFRRVRRRREARQGIYQAVAKLSLPMRIVAGKLVVNVIPEKAPHKGDALMELRRREGADTALYVGDDVTDEDVFELDQPGRLLSVRVGQSRRSAATYFLRNQREMDNFLQKLVDLRT